MASQAIQILLEIHPCAVRTADNLRLHCRCLRDSAWRHAGDWTLYSLTWERLALPLTQPLHVIGGDSVLARHLLLLHLRLKHQLSGREAHGVGEVAPLPGEAS